MKMTKPLRQVAWDHEFELADEAACSAHGRLERVRRLAAHRAGRPEGANAQPSPCAEADRRDVIRVGRGIPDLSRHGRTRLQQRGIAIEQVLTVLDYGREQRAHGASRFFLDRRSRERLAVEMPDALRSLRTLDIHVVLSDEGSLITAAHRTKRIRREIQHSRRRTND